MIAEAFHHDLFRLAVDAGIRHNSRRQLMRQSLR